MSLMGDQPAVKSVLIGSLGGLGAPMMSAIVRELRDAGVDIWTVNDIGPSTSYGGAVMNAINAAGFVIADITDFTPDTMYELGYAHAIRKPVLMIIREGEGRRVPNFLAGFLYYVYNDREINIFPRKIRAIVEENYLRRLAA